MTILTAILGMTVIILVVEGAALAFRASYLRAESQLGELNPVTEDVAGSLKQAA